MRGSQGGARRRLLLRGAYAARHRRDEAGGATAHLHGLRALRVRLPMEIRRAGDRICADSADCCSSPCAALCNRMQCCALKRCRPQEARGSIAVIYLSFVRLYSLSARQVAPKSATPSAFRPQQRRTTRFLFG